MLIKVGLIKQYALTMDRNRVEDIYVNKNLLLAIQPRPQTYDDGIVNMANLHIGAGLYTINMTVEDAVKLFNHHPSPKNLKIASGGNI